MTRLAADTLGLTMRTVRLELGDSTFPAIFPASETMSFPLLRPWRWRTPKWIYLRAWERSDRAHGSPPSAVADTRTHAGDRMSPDVGVRPLREAVHHGADMVLGRLEQSVVHRDADFPCPRPGPAGWQQPDGEQRVQNGKCR